jgi:hypothetical protein
VIIVLFQRVCLGSGAAVVTQPVHKDARGTAVLVSARVMYASVDGMACTARLIAPQVALALVIRIAETVVHVWQGGTALNVTKVAGLTVRLVICRTEHVHSANPTTMVLHAPIAGISVRHVIYLMAALNVIWDTTEQHVTSLVLQIVTADVIKPMGTVGAVRLDSMVINVGVGVLKIVTVDVINPVGTV